MSDGNIVSQNVETQTVIDNNITVQVAQEVQEQITVGVPGPRGPVGPTGPMGSGVAWRGEYDPATAYLLYDAVAYLGSSYACLVPCTGVLPTETSNWEIVASKGDAGADSTVPGPTGAQGATGAQGTQGIQGIKGDTGSTGAQGPTGSQGIQGETGAAGLAGEDSTVPGPQGETGPQGIQGETGATGEDSIVPGPQGIQGVAGSTGAKGDTGLTGAAGEDSTVAGPKGDTGSQGIQGIQGLAGADGVDGDAFVYADFTEGQLAALIGPPGEDGAKGDTGSQGIQGTTGTAGAKGDTGLAGSDGTNGSDGKTVLNGSGVPAAGLGVDGDFYIDTTADTIYGPKTSGSWGSSTSIIGPQGIQGETGAGGSDAFIAVHQVGHGLSVGNGIYCSGANTYAKAKADAASTSDVVGVVSAVSGNDDFTFCAGGKMTTGVSAVAAGTVLFLSDGTAGLLTATEPTTVGHIRLPIAIVTENAVSMIVYSWLGAEIMAGGANSADVDALVLGVF